MPTKVRLDPQKNRPYFYNLINAQSIKKARYLTQNKQLHNVTSHDASKFLIHSRDRVDEMVVDQLIRVDGGRPDQSGRWPNVLVGGWSTASYDKQSKVSISRQSLAAPTCHSQWVVQIDRSFSFTAAWADRIQAQIDRSSIRRSCCQVAADMVAVGVAAFTPLETASAHFLPRHHDLNAWSWRRSPTRWFTTRSTQHSNANFYASGA